jgi:hypothetical protein
MVQKLDIIVKKRNLSSISFIPSFSDNPLLEGEEEGLEMG